MTTNVFRFEFEQGIPLTEAEMSLHLAMYAVEGLYGEARVRLEASYHLDVPHQAITVDGSTEVGAAIVKVFTRLMGREFGEDGFRVRRVETHTAEVAAGKAYSAHDSESRTIGD
ncbi:MAG: hypothetical protein JSU86_03110 [Phycisphaerales bacterium]|nr:MAG: hypothetical protein JSU86_03110 [Phycisphaerales bacterium]